MWSNKFKGMKNYMTQMREGKSFSVENNVSQTKAGRKSVICFVDNRTGMVRTDRFSDHRPILGLPGVCQYTAKSSLSRLSGMGVCLQLKALAENKLNVVGEEHSESNKRRDKEEALARSVVHGGYWREGEFRGRDGVYGDSSELAVEMNAGYLVNLTKIYVGEVGRYAALTEGEKKNMNDDFKKMFRFPVDAVAHNARITDPAKRKNALVDDMVRLWAIIEDIQNARNIPSYVNFPRAIQEVEKHLGGRNSTEINSDRSTHMNQVAISNANIAGIWKVGITHISQMQPVPGSYEILTQEEFNTEYKSQLS